MSSDGMEGTSVMEGILVLPSKCPTFSIKNLNYVKPNLVMFGILLFTFGTIPFLLTP
jgi:hypothetical protein